MGIMVVYDVTAEKSYASVKTWMAKILENTNKNVKKVLVANKCDLQQERAVSKDRGQSLAESLGISYVEVSALSNSNVEEAFMTLAKDILERVLRFGTDETAALGDEKKSLEEKRSFCASC